MKPVIVFIWTRIDLYGGVRTFLLQCLRHLPQMGYRPVILDVGSGRGPLDDEARPFDGAIIRICRRHFETEDKYWKRVHKHLNTLYPSLLVFCESHQAEDVLRGVAEGLPAINLCLVDRPDERYYKLAAALAPRMSATIGNSEHIVARLKQEFDPLRRLRIHKLMIGVEIPPPKKVCGPHQPLRIIFMSRLNLKPKKAGDLVPFAEKLGSLGVDYHLTIAGTGEAEAYLREKLAPHMRSGRVEILDVCGLPARHLLDRQDVLVMFSEYEGLPLVLLEAMVRGVVPVVSHVPSGIGEILINGHNGLIFPIGAPDRAAEHIEKLAENKTLFENLRRNASETGRHFPIDQTMSDFSQIMSLCLAGDMKS